MKADLLWFLIPSYQHLHSAPSVSLGGMLNSYPGGGIFHMEQIDKVSG